jgi:hypothetical protein
LEDQAMKLFAALFASACLVGCAGSPVGDAIAGPERLAVRDDATCQSYGAAPGSDAYAQCRMMTANNRHAGHQAAYNRAAIGMAMASQPAPVAQPVQWINPPPQTVIVQPRPNYLQDSINAHMQDKRF